MEYPRAYKWNIIEYPRIFNDIPFMGLPQEYPYSDFLRRAASQKGLTQGWVGGRVWVWVCVWGGGSYIAQSLSLSLSPPPQTDCGGWRAGRLRHDHQRERLGLGLGLRVKG